MKKILLVLMVCLTMTLQANSQTHLNDTCRVPCNSLRKALLINNENKKNILNISILRDSIKILENESIIKDSIIFDNIKIINIKDTIINNKNNIIMYNNRYITQLRDDNAKLNSRSKIYLYGGVGLSLLTLLLGISL